MPREEKLRASDGAELALYRYEVPSPRAALCVLHGLGEHSRRYDAIADMWNRNGFSLAMLDYRGHGRSPGKRGNTPYNRTVQDALELIRGEARQEIPIILYGHSFGGGLALHMMLTRPVAIAGGIVTSPWLRLKRPLGKGTVAMLGMARKFLPGFTIDNGLDSAGLCHDKTKTGAYAGDPLVHSRISLDMALGAHRAAEQSLERAGELPVPLLLMHGDSDPICDVLGSREFAKKAGEKCAYREYPGMLHELHNEDVWETMFAEQLRFVQELISR